VVVVFSTAARASGGSRPPEITDANPPTGTILNPLPGTWTAYVSLSVRFMDLDGIMYSSLSLTIDGIPLGWSWSPPILYGYGSGFADGPHTAEARASDQLGNGPTVLSWSFSVDTTPPVIAITSPSGNPELAKGFVTVAWTGSDNGSGIDHYEIRLDNGPPVEVGTATTFPYRDLAPGVHYFQVSAYDVARNSAYLTTMATVPRAPGTPTNTTTQITVVMPDAIPSWAIVLVAVNAAEAGTIVWIALRRRNEPPRGDKPAP